MTTTERDCKHGQLARSCEICALTAENYKLTALWSDMKRQRDALKQELEAAKAEIERLESDDLRYYDAGKVKKERDALQAKLTALEKQEPAGKIAWCNLRGNMCICDDSRCDHSVDIYLAAGAAHKEQP